jgi:DNA polymerase-1
MDHLIDAPVPQLPDDYPMELLVADYAQLEMRIMAHFSGDENMIKAIKDDLDLHCWTGHLASEYIREAGMTKDAFDYDDLKKAKKAVEAGSNDPRDLQLVDVRSAMKAIGFGLLYGIGAVKLGRQLNLPITESVSRKNGRVFQKCALAEKLIDAYFSAYPGVKDFIDQTHESAKKNLHVQTYTGRLRRLPDIASYDRGVAAQAERQSVNSIIQGTAADITNEAMLKCENDAKLRSYGCRLLLQIHDELVFEVPKDPGLIEKSKARVRQLMEDPFDMLVPIAISMDTAESWGEAK